VGGETVHFETQIFTLNRLTETHDWAAGQQLRLAFENSILSLIANIFCAFIIVVLLWPVINNQGLVAWLGSICVITFSRLMLQQRFEKVGLDRPSAYPLWRAGFIVGVGISGCAWGALSIFLFPENSVLHQAYLAFVLCGICASGVSAYAPQRGAFHAFAVPVLIPYAYTVWATGSPEAAMMAMLVMVFLLILMRTASQVRKNVGDVLALQEKNADLTRALHHRATHDSMVDLVNHGEFNRRLERLATEERREGSEYSLIFVDLDLFKEVNDRGGHAAGDKILIGIAKILQDRIRSTDTAARVGGDEFALLLNGCPHRRAAEIAEFIRQDIADLKVESDDETYSVHASIGISYGEAGVHSAAAMLKAADAACYTAKKCGRNQVHINKASDLFETTERFDLTKGTFA
jgi:diguanylate cyclase (GGDEF)-like protein